MSIPVHLKAEYNNTRLACCLAALVAGVVFVLILLLPLSVGGKCVSALVPLFWWYWFCRSLTPPVALLYHHEQWYWAYSPSDSSMQRLERLLPIWHPISEVNLLWRDGRVIVLAFPAVPAIKPRTIHMYLTPSTCGERVFRQLQRHFLYTDFSRED